LRRRDFWINVTGKEKKLQHMESASLEYCCIVVFLNGICEDKYPDINLCSAPPPVVITRDKKLGKRGNLARADSHEQLMSNAGWSKLDLF
jgi:hypothetical protein